MHALAVGTLCLGCVAAGRIDPAHDRSDIYDALYRQGYQVGRHGENYTQSQTLLTAIANLTDSMTLRTALDVGCSHGFGVARLWELGLRASGVDLSSVAVEKARKLRGEEAAGCCEERDGWREGRCVAANASLGLPTRCFQQGSAADLPWPTAAFDVVMSSDVLEHLPRPLVDQAVYELARVARKLLVLKISVRPEGVTSAFKRVAHEMQSSNHSMVRTLHETVQHSSWWIAKFAAHGFVPRSKLSTPGWSCCAFVLERSRGV